MPHNHKNCSFNICFLLLINKCHKKWSVRWRRLLASNVKPSIYYINGISGLILHNFKTITNWYYPQWKNFWSRFCWPFSSLLSHPVLNFISSLIFFIYEFKYKFVTFCFMFEYSNFIFIRHHWLDFHSNKINFITYYYLFLIIIMFMNLFV